MKSFFFSLRPEPNELPVQQRVNLVALYAVTLVSLLVVPYQFLVDLPVGDPVPLLFEGVYLVTVLCSLGTFWFTRNLGWAKTLLGAGIFVLSAYLIVVAGGTVGLALFYILAALPLLGFVLGFEGAIVFIALFFVGVMVRVLWTPLPLHSLFADARIKTELLVVFGVSTALGLITASYQKFLIEYLSRLAYVDSVTGLATRSRIGEDLDLSLRTGKPFFLIGIKLFKLDEVSAHWGVSQGDKAMAVTGSRIRAGIGEGSLAGRWSGTFFLVRIPETSPEEALHTARALLSRIQEAQPWQSGSLSLLAGAAVTRFPEDGPTVDRLVANLTMTLGQREGAGKARLFNEEAWRTENRRFQISAKLKGAVGRGEFSLVYQPKVSLPDRKPLGAEVLLRWTHPELGVVSPGEFIPVAETSGLIREITWFVVERFLDEHPTLAASGLMSPGAYAINLSPADLSQDFLADLLVERLASRGLTPAALQLEITEGVMLGDDTNMKVVLKSLKDAGFQLVIDDFGTGFSSLSYLHRLEADGLKIDQSFVRQLGSISAMPPIVDAVLSMGRALRMQVIAEGVETEAQAAYLVENGCRYAQGYLFSKPLPLAEYLKWLASR